MGIGLKMPTPVPRTGGHARRHLQNTSRAGVSPVRFVLPPWAPYTQEMPSRGSWHPSFRTSEEGVDICYTRWVLPVR